MKTKNPPTKRIILSQGGKGGTGKTTVLKLFADYLTHLQLLFSVVDADSENKNGRGSLSSFYAQATKLDLRTSRGLDDVVDSVLDGPNPVVLCDLAAASGKETFEWFEIMHGAVAEAGVAITLVSPITSSMATTQSLLEWAGVLRDRVQYLVVLNQQAGEDFSYFTKTEEGNKFRLVAKPEVIHLQRLALQNELDNHGLTAAQFLKRDDIGDLGPILGKTSARLRVRGDLTKIFDELDRVRHLLTP